MWPLFIASCNRKWTWCTFAIVCLLSITFFNHAPYCLNHLPLNLFIFRVGEIAGNEYYVWFLVIPGTWKSPGSIAQFYRAGVQLFRESEWNLIRIESIIDYIGHGRRRVFLATVNFLRYYLPFNCRHNGNLYSSHIKTLHDYTFASFVHWRLFLKCHPANSLNA